MEDDDRSSSANGFSLIEKHQNKADDFDADGKEKAQFEPPSKSTMKSPSLVELAKVSYRDIYVGIYTDAASLRSGARRFFYDPIVHLDLDSIASESNELLKMDLVRFKIKMWDAELRARVLDRIRSLPSMEGEDIHQDDIYVLPFEEVQLTVEPGSLISSIKWKNKPIQYGRLSESLDFQLECASSAVAVELAENLKKNPVLFLKQWELALECRGLALRAGTKLVNGSSSKNVGERPTWLFNVSTLPCEAVGETHGCDDEEIEDEEVSNRNSTNCVPVFSVANCTNPAAARDVSYGYSSFVMDAKTDHGDFDLPSGIFTVKTAGNYQLNFNGYVSLVTANLVHRFDLKVNGKPVAMSLNQSAVETGGYEAAVISTLLPLKTGDKIGIFAYVGKLYEDANYKTRFYGILFPN